MMDLRKLTACVLIVSTLPVAFLFYHVFVEERAATQISHTYFNTREFSKISEDKNIYFYVKKINTSIACSTCVTSTNRAENKMYEYFSGKYSLDKPPLRSWVKQESTFNFCDNRGTIYGDWFGMLHNVTLFPLRRRKAADQAKGGEEIRQVLNQKQEKEVYIFNQDFLEMECTSGTDTTHHPPTMEWFKSLKLIRSKESATKYTNLSYDDKYVVAIRRQDYANLHNWVRNIYNTFVIMIHFRIQPKDMCILFMDGHPRTDLDKAWMVAYNKPLRVGHMSQPITFKTFVLGLEENKGPITEFDNQHVPYLEEFRSFLLSQFDLEPLDKLNCSKPRITVIIRRNSVYHPRNIDGKVGRKIFNEAELISDLANAFPSACVKPSLMEALPMTSQLDIIKRTDILIGMHGAGMSHVMFLPKHAGILELFAKDFKRRRPWYKCFQSVAKWRNLHYDSWENFDGSLEMPSDFTVLPTAVIVDKARGIMKKICS